MSEKTFDRVVMHRNLYMMQGGKMEKVPVGTVLKGLTAEQVEAFGSRVADPKDQKALKDGELADAQAAADELAAVKAELAAAQKALQEMAAKSGAAAAKK